jgi:hypothetical protein
MSNGVEMPETMPPLRLGSSPPLPMSETESKMSEMTCMTAIDTSLIPTPTHPDSILFGSPHHTNTSHPNTSPAIVLAVRSVNSWLSSSTRLDETWKSGRGVGVRSITIGVGAQVTAYWAGE